MTKRALNMSETPAAFPPAFPAPLPASFPTSFPTSFPPNKAKFKMTFPSLLTTLTFGPPLIMLTMLTMLKSPLTSTKVSLPISAF